LDLTQNIEQKFAKFLKDVADGIAKATGTDKVRYWSDSYHQTPLRESVLVCKPEIILLDEKHRGEVTWCSVHAVTKVTTKDYDSKTLEDTVRDKSYVILVAQANRVHVPILSFWGNCKFQLAVTDREGQLRSHVIDIGGRRPPADSLALLRIIAALCFAERQHIGYDPTMIADAADKIQYIRCEDKMFEIVQVLYETQSLVGRATRVWDVKYRDNRYVLKDAWVEKSCPVAEYQHLQHIAGVTGVPALFCGWDVSVGGKLLSMSNIREGLGTDPQSGRIQRRVVSSMIGSHIASFRSKYKLVSAFRDIMISAPCLPSDSTLY
jgi:Fungal protein kinase